MEFRLEFDKIRNATYYALSLKRIFLFVSFFRKNVNARRPAVIFYDVPGDTSFFKEIIARNKKNKSSIFVFSDWIPGQLSNRSLARCFFSNNPSIFFVFGTGSRNRDIANEARRLKIPVITICNKPNSYGVASENNSPSLYRVLAWSFYCFLNKTKIKNKKLILV